MRTLKGWRAKAVAAVLGFPLTLTTCNGADATSPSADGTGTPGQLALWVAADSLGDAPIKVDANGNLFVRPGVTLIIPRDDGKCIELGGSASLRELAADACPTF